METIDISALIHATIAENENIGLQEAREYLWSIDGGMLSYRKAEEGMSDTGIAGNV